MSWLPRWRSQAPPTETTAGTAGDPEGAELSECAECGTTAGTALVAVDIGVRAWLCPACRVHWTPDPPY